LVLHRNTLTCSSTQKICRVGETPTVSTPVDPMCDGHHSCREWTSKKKTNVQRAVLNKRLHAVIVESTPARTYLTRLPTPRTPKKDTAIAPSSGRYDQHPLTRSPYRFQSNLTHTWKAHHQIALFMVYHPPTQLSSSPTTNTPDGSLSPPLLCKSLKQIVGRPPQRRHLCT